MPQYVHRSLEFSRVFNGNDMSRFLENISAIVISKSNHGPKVGQGIFFLCDFDWYVRFEVLVACIRPVRSKREKPIHSVSS